MTADRPVNALPALAVLRARLIDWLVERAYPLWARLGIDAEGHGFAEALDQNGVPLARARRARIHPRQIYAFAQAARFGWRGDAVGIVSRGIDYFTGHYRRSDGFFRTLVSAAGAVLDDRALLYDQAFALVGYAAAAIALDARQDFERRALELRGLIEDHWGIPGGGFRSGDTDAGRRESNPHMHLLEACLMWAEIGRDPEWASWCTRLIELALSRFIRKDTGALGEAYTIDWRPESGVLGRVIEPGHQFEWAWLLLRAEHRHPSPLRAAALRLIAIGEAYGVRNEVAVNCLLDDLSVRDAEARLWPQTERLKAALAAARRTGEARFWSMALEAAESLLPYLDTPLGGLWFDTKLPSGTLLDSPAPASTFYHLVGAISALNAALEPLSSGSTRLGGGVSHDELVRK